MLVGNHHSACRADPSRTFHCHPPAIIHFSRNPPKPSRPGRKAHANAMPIDIAAARAA
jgi:hypothetical protein